METLPSAKRGRPTGSKSINKLSFYDKMIFALEKEAKKRGTKLARFIAEQFFEDKEIRRTILNRAIIVPDKNDGTPGQTKTGIIVIRSDMITKAETIEQAETYKPPKPRKIENTNINVIKNDSDI